MTEKTPSAPFASGSPPCIGTPGMSPPLTRSTRSAEGARSRNVTSRFAAISGETTGGGCAGGACASAGAVTAISIKLDERSFESLPFMAAPSSLSLQALVREARELLGGHEAFAPRIVELGSRPGGDDLILAHALVDQRLNLAARRHEHVVEALHIGSIRERAVARDDLRVRIGARQHGVGGGDE